MRLALASDLHADCWQGQPGAALDWAAAPAADVLLLAGDLHDLQHGSADELCKAAQVRRRASVSRGYKRPNASSRAHAAPLRSATRWFCGWTATTRRSTTAQPWRAARQGRRVRARWLLILASPRRPHATHIALLRRAHRATRRRAPRMRLMRLQCAMPTCCFGALTRGGAPPALPLPANVVFLGGGQTHLVDGVLFVGACGWWDFEFCRPECAPAAARARFNEAAVDDWCARSRVCSPSLCR